MSPSDTALRTRFQAALAERRPIHVDRLAWDQNRIAAHRCDSLRRLLAYAIEYSPFHAGRLAGVQPDTFELDDLSSLPVMTKAEMMAAFDDVVTDRRLSLKGVNAHLRSIRAHPTLLGGDRLAVLSGGSTGRRGVFVYDFDAMVDFVARFQVQAGPTATAAGQTGPPPGRVGVIAAVGSPRAVHMSGVLPALASGPEQPALRVDAGAPLDEIVDRLNEVQPAGLYGFTNVIRRLALEQISGRLSIRPSRVMVGGEQVKPFAAAQISSAFGAPIVDSFAASEGVVGARLPGRTAFTFASDLIIFEPVDEEDRPVRPGALASRVLITNLFNRVQPLIRYAMDDRLAPLPATPDQGHLVATVEGRREGFMYRNTYVDARAVLRPLEALPQIVDWRVRQTLNGLEAELLLDGTLDAPRLAAELNRVLSDVGLTRPRVSLTVIDHLDHDPRTGKTRRWVPLSIGAEEVQRQ